MFINCFNQSKMLSLHLLGINLRIQIRQRTHEVGRHCIEDKRSMWWKNRKMEFITRVDAGKMDSGLQLSHEASSFGEVLVKLLYKWRPTATREVLLLNETKSDFLVWCVCTCQFCHSNTWLLIDISQCLPLNFNEIPSNVASKQAGPSDPFSLSRLFDSI